MKICEGCNNLFFPSRSSQKYCSKKCQKRQYYRDNKEEMNKKSKKYQEDNKEKLKEYYKQYYDVNKEEIKKLKKQYYKENREKILEWSKQYHKANKEKIAERDKQYYKVHKEEKEQYNKQYYKANKEKISKQKKIYREANKERIREKERKRSKTQARKEWRREYMLEYYPIHIYNNPKKRLHGSFSTLIYNALKKRGSSKNGYSWEKIVGYTTQDLMEHLERQFKNGMSWDNYGKWHVDHFKPVSLFNFTSYEDDEFQECWALKNLQPLWAEENFKKGSKY